jgi:hypothetical protein
MVRAALKYMDLLDIVLSAKGKIKPQRDAFIFIIPSCIESCSLGRNTTVLI